MISSTFSTFELTKIVTFFLVSYVAYYYYRYFTRVPRLPGPLPIPFFGNILHMVILYKGDLTAFADMLHEKYGDIVEMYLGSERQIWLGRPDLVTSIMNPSLKKTNYFQRGHHNPNVDDIKAHDYGLFLMRDLQKWRYYNHFYRQALTSPKFIKSVVPEMESLFNELSGYLDMSNPNDIHNTREWMTRFTMEFIVRITAQKKTYLLKSYFSKLNPYWDKSLPSDEVKKNQELMALLKNVLVMMISMLVYPYWITHYVPVISYYYRENIRKYDVLMKQICEIVKEKRKAIEETLDGEELANDFLTQVMITNTSKGNAAPLGVSDMEKEPMGDYECARLMIEVFIAGADSTANTIQSLIYHICKHPEVEAKLLEEIKNVVGTDPNTPIQYEMMNKLTYTEAVIKETTRMLHVIPISFKTASEDDEIGGIKFPKGSLFVAYFQRLSNHPSVWADPDRYDPERFLGEGSDKFEKENFFMFGGGIRICPGRFLAMTTLKTFIVLLFRKYEITLINPDKPLEYDFELARILRPKMIQVHQRKWS